MESRVRELALFNLGIDSKLRGCDLVALTGPGRVARQPSGRTRHRHAAQSPAPVQFEITADTRGAVQTWIKQAGLKPEDFLVQWSRRH